MKTRIVLSKRSLQVYITVISVICISCSAFGMEPIGTIGQPFPEQHAFLSNEAIVRVTPARIQIIDTNTSAVIDEFAEREYFSDVVLSPDASHLAILTHAHDGKRTTVSIWDVNAREQVSEWGVEFRIYDVAAFSPTEPLFAIPSEDAIHLWNWKTGEPLGRMTGTRRPLQHCHFFDGGSSCEGDPRDRTAIFSPEGRYLIIASMRPDIELWNIETRQLEGHFEGHTGNWVEKVAISPGWKIHRVIRVEFSFRLRVGCGIETVTPESAKWHWNDFICGLQSGQSTPVCCNRDRWTDLD